MNSNITAMKVILTKKIETIGFNKVGLNILT